MTQPTRPLFYDYDGQPTTAERWNELLLSTRRSVRFTTIGNYLVSTVWLGLDHGLGHQPMIYETQVFDARIPDGLGRTVYQQRYPNRDQAEQGHQDAIELTQTIYDRSEPIDGVVMDDDELDD